MKKNVRKAAAVLLAGTMLLGTMSACTQDTPTGSGSPAPSGSGTPEASQTTGLEYPVTPEELGSGEVKWTEEETDDGWMKVTNTDGATLGYSPDSGVKLIQVDGYAFKDLNKNGLLDGYEDWRQGDDVRSANIASMLTVEDVAGLMLYSVHQRNITEEVNDEQKAFLDQGIRAVLNAASAYPTDTQATWANNMQAYAEGLGLGIPVNFSTDPRDIGVSSWHGNLALAATFDPEIAHEQGEQLSKEYRALGITTLLGPQMDLATEPRWSRIAGTFGEDPALSRDMTEAAVSGYQSTYDESGNDQGWGSGSVNAMIKHWPGDGMGESGRESHYASGKYAVYPGNAFETSLIPFVDGGLSLSSSTGSAAAVMSSYSIAWSEDEEYGELVGSGFSEYKLQLLRSYGFDGVICTDWGVLFDVDDPTATIKTKPWGVEDLTKGERAYMAIKAGVDQFGGLNVVEPILDAYQLGVEEMGEEAILARFQESGARLLKSYFNVGLFDNPYVSVDEAKKIVGSDEANAAGYEAQLKSVVMLKNDGAISEAVASEEKPTVYIPMVYTPASGSNPATATLPVDLKTASQYYNVVTDKLSETLTGPADEEGKATIAEEDIIRATREELADCDYALVFVKSPDNGGNAGGYIAETDTYIPISLQYGTYVADSMSVRGESISGPMVDVEIQSPYGSQYVQQKRNTSYFGQTANVSNSSDLDMILYAANNMPESGKVIVALNASNPTIVSEFEGQVDAILMGFGIDNEVFLEIASGTVEPSALLPFQLPANMETVEAQYEDVPRDMECYVDTAGNTYDFGFGLNWSGVIQDERTEKYCVDPLTEPATQPVSAEG